MSDRYRIGNSQAMVHTDDGCVGVARFTCHEWDEKDGTKIAAHHSVEVQVRFNHTTKKWELVDMRQWEGKF